MIWDQVIGKALELVGRFLPDPAAKAEAQQKFLEMQQAGEFKEIEAQLKQMELDAADRNSARELAKVNMLPHELLSAFYTAGYFVVIAMLLSGKWAVPPTGGELLSGLVGVLTAAQVAIMNFWFGSSHGSKTK